MQNLFYHLLLTDTCNLCCSYCREKIFSPDFTSLSNDLCIDETLPSEFVIDLEDLLYFLSLDPAPVLTFYGGEPLIRSDLVTEIVKRAPFCRFMIQTNGILLPELKRETLEKLEVILLSIDGDRTLTDKNRGNGTYGRIIRSIQYVRDNGYDGELIARMTVTEDTDIFSAVLHINNELSLLFDSIHWQMDANFWNDYELRDIRDWITHYYNPGIKRLVTEWVKNMNDFGKVLKWYPFLGIMDDLLHERKTLLRCGAGHTNYSILTDGTIVPCPAMVGLKDYYLGNIKTTSPLDLKKIETCGECVNCHLLNICGGRCLYAQITSPWPLEGQKLICESVESLIEALCDSKPEIERLIRDKKVSSADFLHTKYNGCEIIP